MSVLVYLNFKGIKKEKELNKTIRNLSDTVKYFDGLSRYYWGLLKFNSKYSGYSFNKAGDVKSYNITEDTSKSSPINFSSIFKGNKYSLVLRYTEIGCDECSSLTVKKLIKLKQQHPDLPIYAFVDFTNYDSYLQWRKVGEIDFPVFYVKKGAFAFDKDCSQYSYIFTVGGDGTASNFFIPNSGITSPLEDYFDHISEKIPRFQH